MFSYMKICFFMINYNILNGWYKRDIKCKIKLFYVIYYKL